MKRIYHFIIGCLNSTAHFYLLKHNNIPMGHIDHLWNKSIELKFVAKLWLYYIFIKRGNLFSLFCYYLYSEKRIPLHLNKLISLFTTQGYVVLREVEIGWTPCSGEDFKISLMIVLFSVIMSIWKRTWPFI